MFAIFTGTDKSLGLKEGAVYKLSVSINVHNRPITIMAMDNGDNGARCSYDSLEELFTNWEFGVTDKVNIELDYDDYMKDDGKTDGISCAPDTGCCFEKHKKCLIVTGILLIIGIAISEFLRL